jgi:disulfide bond formation protein DsbB
MRAVRFLNAYGFCSLIVAGLALAMVVIAQYGFGLTPCSLCLYQRVPYIGILVIGLMAFCYRTLRHRTTMLIMMGLWGLSLALAMYHSGVEAHLWAFPACANLTQGATSVADLESRIAEATVVSCDKPAFVLMGLSMADMNALLSLAMLLYGFFSLKKTKDIPANE